MAYLGTQPNDVRKNIGLYTPSEILDLTSKGNWGGSLNLIEETNLSGSAQINFTSIQESRYNVHLLQVTNMEQSSASGIYPQIRVSNDGGSSYENSNYQRGIFYMGKNGVSGTVNSTSATEFHYMGIGESGESINFYVFFYDLGNASKYTFITNHSGLTGNWLYIGSQTYTVAETNNALRLFNSGSHNFTDGKAKLFGIKK